MTVFEKANTMITLEDFKQSSFDKKCHVVTVGSEYMTLRMVGACKVYLYQAEYFFIEVYYSPKYKKVLMIHAFNDIEGLMPYADNVSLKDLGL